MNWKESLLNRSYSSESDLSSLDPLSPQRIPKSCLRPPRHSFGKGAGLDMIPIHECSDEHDNHSINPSDIEGCFESDNKTIWSVAFELSDCNSHSVGTSVMATQPEERSTIIITPVWPQSTPLTPKASIIDPIPNFARPSAVKWSESLFARMPADDFELPVSLTAIFEMHTPGTYFEFERIAYDLECSSETMEIIDEEAIEEIFGDDFSLSGSVDSWENSVDAWESLADMKT